MYVILNKQSTIQKMNKIELYCLLLLDIPWVLNTPTGDTGVIGISPRQTNARTWKYRVHNQGRCSAEYML